MQTLEEKRALLQRAAKEGKVVRFCNAVNDWRVLFVGETCWFGINETRQYEDSWNIKSTTNLHIVEPRKTDKEWANDLAAAIERINIHMDATCVVYGLADYKYAKYLAKRYRSQQDD